MATKQHSQGAVDFTTAYKSLFFDLPMASLKWRLGMGEEKDATIAVWKGYDASVRIATAAVDALYRNPLFSDVFSRTLSTMLQWQQIGNAVSGTVFTSLWKTMGVPTADEVQILAEQLRGLENRLSQMAQTKDVQTLLDQLRALDARLPRTAPTVVRTNHHEERAAA
ncbi:MAG: hypothetical protein AB7P69_14875 [Candidatus Binatia bacterium]